MGLDLMRSFTEINWEEVGRSMARLLKDGFKALAEGAGGLLPTAKSTGQSMVNAFSDIDWLALGRSILSGILTGVKAIAYGAGGLIYVVSEIVEASLRSYLALTGRSRVRRSSRIFRLA